MKGKSNKSRIRWREKPLWQESEFKTQRQRLCKSWKIWQVLKVWGQQQESLKQGLKKCWMLSDTVWAILQVPTMSRMGKTRKMMKKIQSSASWVMKMNLAGWWAQSPKQYSTVWKVFCRSRWGLTNWGNQDGGTQPTTSVTELGIKGLPNWRSRRLWSTKWTQPQPHHPQWHLQSICTLLKLSADNCKWRQWLLDQDVVKWGGVQRNPNYWNF